MFFLKKKIKTLLLFCFVCGTKPLSDKQENKEIHISADLLKGGTTSDGEKYNELINNVKILIDNMTICTEYAVFFPDKNVIISNLGVKILDTKGTVIAGDILKYSGDSKMVSLIENVKITNEGAEFSTDRVDYSLSTEKGTFSSQGKFINDENCIICNSGVFDTKNRTIESDSGIEMHNKELFLYSDTIIYNDNTKIVNCKGHTRVVNKAKDINFSTDNVVEYSIEKKIAHFTEGTLKTDKLEIKAQEIIADFDTEISTVKNGVTVNIVENLITISGSDAFYDHKKKYYYMNNRPLFIKYLDRGNLYLRADECTAVQTDDNIEVKAEHNILLYQREFQAKFETMNFIEKDSTIYVKGSPIIWNYSNQITSESARIIIKEKDIDKIVMDSKALLVFPEKKFFNQIKGDTITINFKKNNINNICIDKNVELIYYMVIQKRLEGLNELKCGKIKIVLKKDNINRIIMPLHSQGVFIPSNMLNKDKQKFFNNFTWRDCERPTKKSVLS